MGGADAPQRSLTSLKDMVWRQGIATLVRMYNQSVPEREVRSRLGLLIKQFGQGKVLDAMVKAEAAEVLEPLDWMTAMLGGSKPQASKMSRWS